MPPRLTAQQYAALSGGAGKPPARPRQVRGARKQGRPEAALLRLVLRWCAARGIWAQRLQAGVLHVEGRRVSLGTPGTADVMILHAGRAYFAELKAPGGRLRPSQRAWIERAERAGATVFVVRSLAALEDALRAEGVI